MTARPVSMDRLFEKIAFLTIEGHFVGSCG